MTTSIFTNENVDELLYKHLKGKRYTITSEYGNFWRLDCASIPAAILDLLTVKGIKFFCIMDYDSTRSISEQLDNCRWGWSKLDYQDDLIEMLDTGKGFWLYP